MNLKTVAHTGTSVQMARIAAMHPLPTPRETQSIVTTARLNVLAIHRIYLANKTALVTCAAGSAQTSTIIQSTLAFVETLVYILKVAVAIPVTEEA